MHYIYKWHRCTSTLLCLVWNYSLSLSVQRNESWLQLPSYINQWAHVATPHFFQRKREWHHCILITKHTCKCVWVTGLISIHEAINWWQQTKWVFIIVHTWKAISEDCTRLPSVGVINTNDQQQNYLWSCSCKRWSHKLEMGCIICVLFAVAARDGNKKTAHT